ncbi:MAG: putative polysaccharide biosynthesis protein with aminopeptidase-like domain protein [Dehalococcoidia bacterium]|nr:putative polysaccharide biosynthesis protein with aminopeptidase-like domain protein [Bacillota bacterium]
MASIGDSIYALLRRLFPINRSITGDGVRETLCIIAEELPALTIHEVPSGTQVFDWVVPREWNVRDAYVLDPDGNKIIDFAKSNLHLVGYSIPVIRKVSLSELEEHLYSLPDQPAVIPYIISYYEERWGFCITHRRRQMITKEGEYTVVIDSELKDGYLTYGELRIPGERQEEVFFSTYICHPSMANNELSGPTVTTFLAKWLLSQKRKYSYRIVFIPETIGSITYLSRNLDEMKRRIIAGYNVTCVGDDSCYSFLPSRQEDSLADRAALHVLKHLHPNFVRYTYLDRGSDERQYCAPGVDLPVALVMRSKYGTYPEYHTSLDDLTLVTSSGLQGAYEVLCKCVECIEADEVSAIFQSLLDGLFPHKFTSLCLHFSLSQIRFCPSQRVTARYKVQR